MPTSKIRVSAIVSAYRSESHMRGRLENLVGQTLFARGELEIVVVDSGSPENEEAIVRDFQARYPNILYLRTAERETVYGAWNRGIKASCGQYVTNQNTDDRLKAHALQRLAGFLDQHPETALVHGDQVQVPSGTPIDLEAYEGPGHWQWHPFSRLGLIISTQVGSQPMWRRSLHDRVGYFDDTFRILGDQEFFLRASLLGNFRFLPEILGSLDYRPTSVSQNVAGSKQEWIRILEYYTAPAHISRLLTDEPDEALAGDRHQALINNLVCHLRLESIDKAGLPFPSAVLQLMARAVTEGSHQATLYRNLMRLLSQLFSREQISVALPNESPQRLDELLAELEERPDFEFLPDPLWCVSSPSVQTSCLVSIIIPLYNRVEYTRRCLEALSQNTPEHISYEVVLVDNASSDETPALLAGLEGDVTIVSNPQNLGFAKACNQGAAAATGKYLLFLNNDTEVQPGWLEPLVQVLDVEPDVAAVGAKLLFPDGTLQHAGVSIVEDQRLGHPVSAWHRFYLAPADFPAACRKADMQTVTGAAMLIRPEVFAAVGGFDEAYWNGYEDVDLCFKLIERHWRIVYQPQSRIIHYESVSGPERHLKEDNNRRLQNERWQGRIVPDLLLTPDGVLRPHPKRSPVSVVIVTYNSETTLEACIEAALATIRPEDEIVVIDNASHDSTPDLLRALASRDKRMRYFLSSENLGFSAGTNLGIQRSKGRYVALLNPDTIAMPGWLDRMMSQFRHPHVGAVGPTSDYVAGLQKWQLHAPEELSPQATPERIAAELGRANSDQGVETKLLIGFCMLLSRDILDEIGLLDEELFLGNDDLDMSWRLRKAGYRLIVATSAFVQHIGQVSFGSETKDTTRRLVQESTDCLARKLVDHFGPGRVPSAMELWGMNWFTPTPGILDEAEDAPKPAALTSIVMLTWNQLPYTQRCLDSLFRHTVEPFELILVDNGSTDGTVAYLLEVADAHPNVKLVLNATNRGFAGGCNQGMALSCGQYVLLLNNDTVVAPGWLTGLIEALEADGVGAVGPRTNSIIGPQLVETVDYQPTTLEGFEAFAQKWRAQHRGTFQELHRIIGFCMLIRREVVDRIGALDTSFGRGNFEDDDYCLRMQLAGFKLGIAQEVFIHHFGSVTFRGQKIDYRRAMEENWQLFKAKWLLSDASEDGYLFSEALSLPFTPQHDMEPLFRPATPASPLQFLRGFNLVVAEASDPQLQEILTAFLAAFTEEDDVALHVLTGHRMDDRQGLVVELLAQLGLDPEHIPDISLVEAPTTPLELPGYLKAADLVLGSRRAVMGARDMGIPAFDAASPEALQTAFEQFRAIRWNDEAPPHDLRAQERWLVSRKESWQAALGGFLAMTPPGSSRALLIQVEPGGAEKAMEAISGWLTEHGHDPESIPDVVLLESDARTAVFRQATAWVDNGDALDRAIAMGLGVPAITVAPVTDLMTPQP